MQQVINDVLVNFEYLKRDDNTIVFLHGWGGSLNSFKAAFDYFNNNSNYSLLNLDLPAFGKSETPKKIFTIYDYYEIVLKLINILNINKIHLISHSFGARIAVLLGCKNTSIIKTLTLVGAAGIKPRKSLKTSFKILKYKIYKKFIKNKEKLNSMGSSDYKVLTPIMKKTFINIVNENLTKYLSGINCSTLIFWAKDDSQTPFYMAKKFNKKIKNSGLVVFKDGGHFCYLKHHNQFVKATKYFIDKESEI